MSNLPRGLDREVTVVWRFLPHYRADFFCRLRERLARNGIALNLIYGRNRFVPRRDEVDLDWAVPVPNRTVRFAGGSLYWLPTPRRVWNSDLFILMQENRILSNHYLFLRALRKKRKVAFWDHGFNHQAWPGSLGNRLKRLYANRVSWWFAYTEGVARWLAETGFPPERITVVDNAIDTEKLVREAREIGARQVEERKRALGIGNGPVGLYCGGIYREKRIHFLLEACLQIRLRIPSFEMIVIGAGPDAPKVREASIRHPWIHYLGPLFGSERLPFFKMADVFLIPGLVGLAVLDCFAHEVPPITVDFPFHSPEIEYLIDGVNGVITENALDPYVDGVLRVLSSPGLLNRLRQGCREGACRYTLENMVGRFAEGIQKALIC